MENDQIDLRWWLLNHLVRIDYLNKIYELVLIFFFMFFVILSLSPIFLKKYHKTNTKQILLSDLIFVISSVAFILSARWPGLIAGMLNIDEAYLLAGAMKLLKDPVFWHSVEGTTSGPLNFYALTLPAIFGLKLEYASARVVGLFLIIISIICLYFSLQNLYGKPVARLSALPVVTTLALMTYFDYVHYTSEHVSIAILSVALLIFCRYYSSTLHRNYNLIFALGFTVGMTPYAKLQAVPIALSISLIFIHFLWIRKLSISQFLRNFYCFSLSSILFSILTVFYLTIFSLYYDFWKSYIQQNFTRLSITSSFLKKCEIFWRETIWEPKDTRVLFALTGIILILTISLFIRVEIRGYLASKKKRSDSFIFIYYSLAVLGASIYSVVQPGGPVYHYLLFLIIPSGFLIGVFVGELKKTVRIQEPTYVNRKLSLMGVIIVAIVASSFLQVAQTVKGRNRYIVKRKIFAENYISPVSKAILKHASTGESMAIWGWTPELYVETGVVPATRDPATMWQFSPNPQQPYFVKRFADDLLNSEASLFIDSLAPDQFGYIWFDKQSQEYEDFPEVTNLVRKRYKFVEEVESIRIYTRHDRTAVLVSDKSQ